MPEVILKVKNLNVELDEEKIIEDLKKVCEELGRIEGVCKSFVELYTKTIIHYIITHGKDKVCIMIHACPTRFFFQYM